VFDTIYDILLFREIDVPNDLLCMDCVPLLKVCFIINPKKYVFFFKRYAGILCIFFLSMFLVFMDVVGIYFCFVHGFLVFTIAIILLYRYSILGGWRYDPPSEINYMGARLFIFSLTLCIFI
jgi:hypothetical protein